MNSFKSEIFELVHNTIAHPLLGVAHVLKLLIAFVFACIGLGVYMIAASKPKFPEWINYCDPEIPAKAFHDWTSRMI